MSVSFDITDSMLYREFDDSESSAIRCLSVLHNNVTIGYRSNNEKQYIFRASDMFAPVIRDAIRHFDSEEISIGSLIAKARKNGDLQIIEM